MELRKFDVIIVGGSYAGLSAAMTLGRSLRRVLVVDSGFPCNSQTPHSHNFLTQDGVTPAAIAEIARGQVGRYHNVETVAGLAQTARKVDGQFEVQLSSGETVRSRKLIFATGIKDELLPIPGLKECWGISVIHCPYCHGYEYRGRRTGILGNGETALHYATLLRNLTTDLCIFTNGTPDFSDEQFGKLRHFGIPVISEELVQLDHDGGHLTRILLKGADSIHLDALYFRAPFKQHCLIPMDLGVELNEFGYLKVDGMQKTSVQDVFACGDNSSMMRSVANAVATGNLAGASVNRELCSEEFAIPVEE